MQNIVVALTIFVPQVVAKNSSPIPEITSEMFSRAVWRNRSPVSVQLNLDPVVLAWFKTQGEDWEHRIGEVLRGSGYQTMISGKWHVTPNDGRKHNWPLQRGFDRFYGIIAGGASCFQPWTLTRDNQAEEPKGADFYLTDAPMPVDDTHLRAQSVPGLAGSPK